MTWVKRSVATVGATAVLLMSGTGVAMAGPEDSFSHNLGICSLEAQKAFPESNWAYFSFVAACMAHDGF